MPPLAVIKNLRGHFDIYILHVGGVDKVVLRMWPRKGSGYESAAFVKNRNAARMTIESYRLIDRNTKGVLHSFQRGLDDTFLDHFRAGYQGVSFDLQAPPPLVTKIEMRLKPAPNPIEIRFLRSRISTITFNHREKQRKTYYYNLLKSKRGIVCERRYYVRPKATSIAFNTAYGAGWTAWYSTDYDKQLSIYADSPTPLKPLSPYFGPYPIDRLYNLYLQYLV